MTKNTHYDVIIAGGGCAGLGLAWELTQNSEEFKDPLKLLLINESFEPKADKIWCFWDDVNLPILPPERFLWQNIRFKGRGEEKYHELKKYTYQCIRSEHYIQKIIERLQLDPMVTQLEAQVLGFESNAFNAKVVTTAGQFSSKFVFQSVLKCEDSMNTLNDFTRSEKSAFSIRKKSRLSNYHLKQHFLGAEIECSFKVFDPSMATLMDFDVDQKGNTAFMYVLPFSENRALFEYTIFSKDLLDQDVYHSEIEHYLSRKYALTTGDYKIRRIEKGSIPMRDKAFEMNYAPYIYNIGTAAGITKPTTGYTFSRIHRMNKEITRILSMRLDNPHTILKKLPNPSTFRFRLYDTLLLSILDENPSQSIRIFSALFNRNSADAILAFLDEKSGIIQEMKLFLTLPKWLFLKALWANRNLFLKQNS